jgi:hypothetical protein
MLHNISCGVLRLIVIANVPNAPIFVTLKMEALRSSETSVLTRGKWRNITEDGILHSHRCEDLRSHKLSADFGIKSLSVTFREIISINR